MALSVEDLDKVLEQQDTPKNIKIFAGVILTYQILLLILHFSGNIHFRMNGVNSTALALFCLSFDFIAAVCFLKRYYYMGITLLVVSSIPGVFLLTLGLIFIDKVIPMFNVPPLQLIFAYFFGVFVVTWKIIVVALLASYNRRQTRNNPLITPTAQNVESNELVEHTEKVDNLVSETTTQLDYNKTNNTNV